MRIQKKDDELIEYIEGHWKQNVLIETIRQFKGDDIDNLLKTPY
jgi:hypothetical protein